MSADHQIFTMAMMRCAFLGSMLYVLDLVFRFEGYLSSSRIQRATNIDMAFRPLHKIHVPVHAHLYSHVNEAVFLLEVSGLGSAFCV